MNSSRMKKKIAILGSTGSIGTQALEIAREQPELIEVEVLTAHSNADLLIKQAKEFCPNYVGQIVIIVSVYTDFLIGNYRSLL